MNSEPSIKHRMTRQKRVILDVLKGTDTHPTADWVYEKVKKKIPNISLGTVYRNLNILKSQGEILELNFGKGFSRFDGNVSYHYHFTCEHCGRIRDVESPMFEHLNEEVGRNIGHKVSRHRLEFYGECTDCATQ
ncbi:MAG: transcriptional repressor [Nitrospirae bacterium]|nr:transcriptional repressor [Nitrospirota bacterium]MBI5696712.1 transcriptional repressor [Nitrospirota bacterium]